MVEQLKKYTTKIYIVDNCSTYPPLVEFLDSTDVEVIRMPENYGHKVVYREEIRKIGGDKYFITDPDLLLNPDMPLDFMETFCKISDKHRAHKVGVALDVTKDIRDDIKLWGRFTIKDWESQMWRNPIEDSEYPNLWKTGVDTTLCLVNFNYPVDDHLRIAGNFTAVHRPWLTYWKTELKPGELEYYKNNSICSSWI
jgi:hypothetical protein